MTLGKNERPRKKIGKMTTPKCHNSAKGNKSSYVGFVRLSHLFTHRSTSLQQYHNTSWCPQFKKNADKLDQVWRSSMRVIRE